MSWTSAREVMSIFGNATYQDLRNRSRTGAQAAFFNDRIPNRSPFSAYGEARLRARRVAVPNDSLEVAFRSQYTHGFFRTWESAGATAQKDYVSSQVAHSISLTYLAQGKERVISSSVEVQNLTNAKLYDYFGVQRPGRAFFFKLTFENQFRRSARSERKKKLL